jgi:hypothetical protein
MNANYTRKRRTKSELDESGHIALFTINILTTDGHG